MGGLAFRHAAAPGAPALTTPRLSPAEHARLQALYVAKLQGHFGTPQVAGLRAAPEKPDHGDVDLVVGSDAAHVDLAGMAMAVGARGVLLRGVLLRGARRCALAVALDGSAHEGEAVVYAVVRGGGRAGGRDGDVRGGGRRGGADGAVCVVLLLRVVR